MTQEYKIKHSPTCLHCGFAPFCSLEISNPRWIHQINSAVKQEHVLKKNDSLFLPDHAFHSLYAIKSGCLKTYEIDGEGNELIQGFYFPGEILGFEAIARGRYLFYTTALSEALVCEVPYNQFIDLLKSSPHLQQNTLYLMSQQLTIGLYSSLVTAEQRLAAFLIDLAKRLRTCDEHIEIILPMSRQDIGNYLRLSAETISRLFSQFKANQWISVDHKRIQFLQLEQLELIAGIKYAPNPFY